MKKINEVIMMMFSLAVIIIMLMASISMQALNIKNYEKSQIKYDVANDMKIPQDEVTDATLVALGYTKGIVTDLEYHSETLNRDIFSEQDKLHMVDVRDLYGLLFNVVLGMLSIMMMMGLYLFINRKIISVYEFSDAFMKSSKYFLVFVGVLCMFALINFEAFWTMFHKIFFSNDLWLMDPRRDALIQMMPQELFSNLVYKIVLTFLGMLGLFNGVAWWYKNFKIRDEA